MLKQRFYNENWNWTAKDIPYSDCQIKKYALDIDPEVITKMLQNLKSKIHKANSFGLQSQQKSVFIHTSMNYDLIAPIIVSNSFKFKLVQFFLDQTLSVNFPSTLNYRQTTKSFNKFHCFSFIDSPNWLRCYYPTEHINNSYYFFSLNSPNILMCKQIT